MKELEDFNSALADAFNAVLEANGKKIGIAYDALAEERDVALADAKAMRRAWEGACKTIADMHAVALGEIRGPDVGLVEDVEALREERDALRKQLPVGMEDCTILYKRCEKGHGWLTAKNWVPSDLCPKCESDRLQQEVDDLARWKKEQLTVTAWWKEIDDFVRAHPDSILGEYVSKTALKWLKERDELTARARSASARCRPTR